jgi:hypothetical protein
VIRPPRSDSRTRRGKPCSAKDRQGIIILGFIVAFVALVGSLMAYVQHSKPIYGKDTCAVVSETDPHRKPVPQTIVLLDQSERLTDGQRDFVQQTLERVVAEMKKGERLLFFTFSRNEYASLKARLAICKPQDTANPLYETELKIRSHLRSKFVEPVLEIGATTAAEEVGTSSPILEALYAVSHSADLEAWNTQCRLILISDLLQHSEIFSHYRSSPDFRAWLDGPGGQMTPAMKGWNVDIIYLERMKDATRQGETHREFWQQYFFDAGAHIKSWRPVS